jgi:hypothetical protein
MAKSQKRSNREIKKPKAKKEKPSATAATAPAVMAPLTQKKKPGWS